jgi:hypothetical protein
MIDGQKWVRWALSFVLEQCMQAFDFSAAITGTTGAQQQRFQLPHATAPTVWMNLKLWMEKEAVLEFIYIYMLSHQNGWL